MEHVTRTWEAAQSLCSGTLEHQHIKYNNKVLENGIEKLIHITDFKRYMHK